MPYTEDGETWNPDYRTYEEGMAENRPGHKALVDYKLPSWTKHPLTHPTSGVYIDNKDYAYACTDPSSGTALDGLGNHMGYGPSHIAAMYGDMEMLEACSPSELNGRDVNGKTAAHYAVDSGVPWVIQWLVEKGCDTTSEALLQDKKLHSPEELIWLNTRNGTKEIEWLDQALKGELTDKKSLEAQKFKLAKWRQESLDPIVTDYLDAKETELKQRYHFYKMGDFQMPYPMPTDEEVRAKLDLPTAKVPRPPAKSKPPLPVAFMFPGQGSQYPGMLKDAVGIPAVDAMLKEASRILGWDVKEIAMKGTKEQQAVTKVCQPLMFVADMVAIEIMKSGAMKETVERVQAVAGLSLGEYAAICAAGILDFSTCLKLVKLRGEAMQEATDLTPQCMASVAGLERSVVDKTCAEAISKNLEKDPVCQVANVLFPAGFAVSGTKKTMALFCELAKKARALQAKEIATGGAFHCPLMAPASAKLEAAIDSVRDQMQPPRCSIYFNVNAKKVPPGTDPELFYDLMKKQLTSEVLWENTMKQMIMDGVKDFYECGPMKQLQSMMKRIDQDAFKRTQLISV